MRKARSAQKMAQTKLESRKRRWAFPTQTPPWKASEQARPLLAASKLASIEPAASFHILRHMHASTLALRSVPLHFLGLFHQSFQQE
jgi:hypothetical protein